MAYKLAQDFEYKGKDWWEWAIWVEASEAELDKIKLVEYTLHPTFAKPVRIIKRRETKFRLETTGWGTFTVYAKAVLFDGEDVDMQHELELEHPEWEIAATTASDETEEEVISAKAEAEATMDVAKVEVASAKAEAEDASAEVEVERNYE